jgi:hypothetical protein
MKKRDKKLELPENQEPGKEQLLQEILEALNELKLIEQGKLKARPITELLDEL